MMASETGHKQKFRSICGVWSEAYETRSGGGVGYPDLQLLVGPMLLPVEVKVGDLKGPSFPAYKNRVFPHRIRPAQITWLHEFKQAGGLAVLLICVGERRTMDAWALVSPDRDTLARWKDGYHISELELWVSKGQMRVDLISFMNGAK